jgi:glycosyltransferase involved in cell wall biosynthesis
VTRLVVVDATPYGPEPSGARRRGVEVLRRLPALLPDDVFEAHWARDGGGPPADLVDDRLVHAVVDVSCRGGARRWRARAADLRRRHRDAPFTHLLTDHGPVVAPDRVRNVVTVHDLRFLHGFGGWLRRAYGRWLYGSRLARAARVVGVSAPVRDELLSRYRLAPSRVVVSENAPSVAFSRRGAAEVDEVLARVGATRPYLLVVGRDEPRKAMPAAFAAWREARSAEPTLGIVVAGSARAPAGGTSAGFVDDDVLAALYSGARATLCPSLDEGYGLTVAESLACGTPVVASDVPAHRALAAASGGVRLVPPPPSGESWPGAGAAIASCAGASVRAPSTTWDDAARVVADAIASTD